MKLTLEKATEMMRENGGNLNLAYTDVEALPDGLQVGGSRNFLEGNVCAQYAE